MRRFTRSCCTLSQISAAQRLSLLADLNPNCPHNLPAHVESICHWRTYRHSGRGTKNQAPRYFSSTTSTLEPKRTIENIAPETHYDFFPDTLPQGPPPHGPFGIDLRQLRSEFLKLQASAHPDKHPERLKARAEALSARINESYKTLQDPLRRAQYILHLNDVDVEDEASKTDDMETLGLVMEAREEIEEAQTERDLRMLKDTNEQRVKDAIATLAGLLEKGQWEEARQEAVRLKFWYNIREGIDAWKQGEGVPNLVH